MEEALAEARRIIESKSPGFIVAVNPEKIMKASKDRDFRDLLNSASIQIPDGVGILIASRLCGGGIKHRVTGIDLMMNLFRLASESGYRVYMLGAAPGVARKAAQRIRTLYPGVAVSGFNDGYFGDDKDIVERISNSHADMLFVAMGSPKQEYWIARNIEKLGVPLLMGVGGSFDVLCGSVKRAPGLFRRAGAEWLYRLIREPRRIGRMADLPVFLLKVIAHRFKSGSSS